MFTVPWKTIGKFAGTALFAAGSAVITQYQQKKAIEEVGQKVGVEIIKSLTVEDE